MHVNRVSPQKRQAPRNGVDAGAEAALKNSHDLEEYVKLTWPKLQRSMKDIYLGGCKDPKIPTPADNRYFLYISGHEDMARVKEELKRGRRSALRKIRVGSAAMPEGGLPEIEVRRLPPKEEWGHMKLEDHGLLYLPHPYIVPGVRFNEMYNWDSMFVVRGLLESRWFDVAKFVVDDLLYQQDHYGTVLNGNRTYYLNGKSRSQPPLIASKVLNIYDNWDKLKLNADDDKLAWLHHAAETLSNYYQHWVSEPHLHESGLSRYASHACLPAPEVMNGEPGHYEGALAALVDMHHAQKRLNGTPPSYQDRKDRYYLEQYLRVSEDGTQFALTPQFYQGDAAMRESGFDPSRRFGMYNVDVINHLPVCLNSLRYKMEGDMAAIFERLQEADPANAQEWERRKQSWENRASGTKQRINTLLWDEGAAEGEQKRAPCYRDRNINTALCEKHGLPEFRDYNFASALFPLWVGAASKEQADKVIKHIIPKLKTPFGLNTSDRETGCQWDKPLMWAPLQVVAVEALERYEHYYEAMEIATSFLNMVSKDFKRTGKLYEKYESVTGSSDIKAHVSKGYFTNDEGFAWTNASVIELRQAVRRLRNKIHMLPLGNPQEDGVIINRPVMQHGQPTLPPADAPSIINAIINPPNNPNNHIHQR